MGVSNKNEIKRLLRLSREERKQLRETQKETEYQGALRQYPQITHLSKTAASKYKRALATYPDLSELGNSRLILLAYDFRQEQIRSYHTDHTTEYANARCNIGCGGYKSDYTPKDLPALKFEEECVVCWEYKKGVSICPECWQLIRKAFEIKGKSHREGWEGWGYEMNLDLSGIVKLLRTYEEGKRLLDAKIAQRTK